MAETCDESGLNNDDNDREVALEKRSYVMDELVKTERNYVRDLALVVDDYIELMRDPKSRNCDIPVPEGLMRPDVQDTIFSNIEQIYDWHKNVFLNEIESCFTKPLEIGYIFKKNESKFLMYINYSQKNQMFDTSMKEHRLYFEELRKLSCHLYPLRDFLIRPVNRIMTYTLLLREMVKYSKCAEEEEEAEELQQAVDIMERLINSIDKMMVVDRLRDFNGNITAQGKLLYHGALRCAKNPNGNNRLKNAKYKDRYVFLFEHAVIFTTEEPGKKKNSTPLYVYKTHAPTNKITVENSSASGDILSSDSANDSFTIKSTDPDSPPFCFVCQVNCAESRSEWLNNLQDVIQMERNFHPDMTSTTDV